MQPGLKQTHTGADASHVGYRLEQLRDDEGGFTIVESIVALMLIMSVLIGSLAMMGTSVKGIVTSRQRSVATSIAREMVEQARAATYSAVGHDFNDDTTLTISADPKLTGTPLMFEGKKLVASSVDKDVDSPFYPHLGSRLLGGITYQTWAYATEEVPATGDPFKRVTVMVRWGNDQYGGAVDDTVRIETQVFDAAEPPDPLLLGESEVDAGAIRVLDNPPPVISDNRVLVGTLFLPFARSEIESRFVHTIRSSSRSPRSEMVISGSSGLTATSPCIKTTGTNTRGDCAGAAADLIADNDAGTAPVVAPAPISRTYGSGSITRGSNTLGLVFGAGNLASSVATAASTAAGNNDGLPYAQSLASGPDSYWMPFTFGSATGSLADFASGTSAEASVDRAGTGPTSTIVATAKVHHPPVDLLTFNYVPTDLLGTPFTGYAGMVRGSASNVSIMTASGPAAATPTFAGDPLTFSLFQTDAAGAGSYRSVTVTPGSALEEISEARFLVNGQLVVVKATLTATAKVSDLAVDTGTTLRSSTRLSSWLKVRLDVTSDGTRQFSYELDYGRVVADTSYEEPT